jgi:hypothetical protein
VLLLTNTRDLWKVTKKLQKQTAGHETYWLRPLHKNPLRK